MSRDYKNSNWIPCILTFGRLPDKHMKIKIRNLRNRLATYIFVTDRLLLADGFI
jgi:hypothetical protein